MESSGSKFRLTLKIKIVIGVISILSISLITIGFYLSSTRSQPSSTQTDSEVVLETLPEWVKYTSPEQDYTVKYPGLWQKTEEGMVGFTPAEANSNVRWTITRHPLTTSTELIASTTRPEIVDRSEKIETIVHPEDNSAQKITITSPTNPDWQQETIIIRGANSLYAISNGGVRDETIWGMSNMSIAINFKTFYESFSFTDSEESDRSKLGVIRGKLCSKSTGVKVGEIIAYNKNANETTIRTINEAQELYELTLSPGEYRLRYKTISNQGETLYGYYADEESVKIVSVTAGSVTTNVDLCMYTNDYNYQQKLSSEF